MEIKEGYLDYLSYKTYYRIVNPNGKKIPLLMLHGGPGSTHNSFELFDHFAFEDDRPIIMYDQLGCGKSDIGIGHEELWNKETWVNELINLRNKLNLKEIHLLGQSWGGMLLIIYMCDYNPQGIKSCIMSSTLASASLWNKETHCLLNLMDDEDKNILLNAELNNDFGSEEFIEANKKYTYKHIFGPFKEGIDPECLTRYKIGGKEAYLTAWGPCEFCPSGTLKDYEYLDKLDNIKCNVMITSGLYDESTPYQNKTLKSKLKDKAIWHLFNNSRHMSYYEEHNSYIKYLKEFLNNND